MTEDDRERFGIALTGLAEVFNESLSDPKFEAYFSALQDLPIADIERAASTLLGTCRFFPKPVEFREALAGSATDRAESAWRTLVKLCVDEGHYPSLHITDGAMAFAIDHFGGWIEAQAKLNDASPEMVRAYEKQFVASYRLGEQREYPRQYFPGQVEYANRGQLGALIGKTKIPLTVCLVGVASYRRLAMFQDATTGLLRDDCRSALESGNVQKYLPKPVEITSAMLPPVSDEIANPEEVGTIRRYVENFIGRMSGKRMGALPPAPDETTEEAA